MAKEAITDSEFDTFSQGTTLPRMRRNLRTLPESLHIGEYVNEYESYEYEASEPVGTPRIDMPISERTDSATIQDQDSTNDNARSKGSLVHEIGRAVREDMQAQRKDPTERGKDNMTENMLIEVAAQRGAAMVLERIGLGMLSNTGER